MPITLFDGIVAGFTLVSAMLAMVRGFSREVLSIASWAAAAGLAYLLYKPVMPYVQPYIDNETVAMIAAAGIVFLVALIVVTIITMKIADFIIDSRVGALDRAFGFLYGVARGILVLAVALLIFTMLVGSNLPAWVGESKSRPLLQGVGAWVQNALPDDFLNSMLKRVTPNDEAPAEGQGSTPPADAPAEGGTAPADGATQPPANN